MTPIGLTLWALAIALSIIVVGLALLLVIAAVKQVSEPTKSTNVVQLDDYRKPTPTT